MAMRDVIYEAIMQGGATQESLLALTGTTPKGLASQFTYLRMMGKCPMKQDDGTYTIVSSEVWEASRGSSGSTAAPANPVVRFQRAEKRLVRTETAHSNAIERAQKSDDILNQLKLQKAEAEFKIAEIEFTAAKEAYDALSEEELAQYTESEAPQTTEIDTEAVEDNEATEDDEDIDISDDLE